MEKIAYKGSRTKRDRERDVKKNPGKNVYEKNRENCNGSRERERECTEVGTGRDDETFFSLPAGII